MEKDWMYRHTY